MVTFRLSPRAQKIVGDLWHHKSRTALVIFAIVVGLAGGGAVLDAWSLIKRATEDEYRASRPPSATLVVDSLGSAVATRLRDLPPIGAIQRRRVVGGNLRSGNDPTARSLIVFALEDFNSRQIGRVQAEAGAWPPNDTGLVIERSSLDYAGVALGDRVTAQVREGTPVILPVDGIARDVGLAPGWIEHVVYAFATPATLARLGAPQWFNEVQIVVRDSTLSRASIRRIAEEAGTVITQGGGRVTNIDVPLPNTHIHAAQINSLLYTQGAFGVIALLLSGILVVNLVTAMLTGDVREIGIMKTIGAKPAQISALYLTMALALGIVASLVAVPLAATVGHAYARFTAELLNFSTEGVNIPLGIIFTQIAIGLTFPVLAAAIPVSRGSRIAVGDALRDVGIATRDQLPNAAVDRLVNRWGVSRPFLLSLRNAFRKRQRMLLTLLTLATGGATFIGAPNLKESVRGAVALFFAGQRYDMAVRLAHSATPDTLERIVRALSGVTRAEAWGGARATPRIADSTTGNAFSIVALPPSTALQAHDVAVGRWLRDDDSQTLVVNERLVADDSALALGATVDLTIAGQRSEWTIVGVVSGGVSPAAFAPRAAVARIVPGGGVDRIVVASAYEGPASQLELIQRLRASLTDAGFTVDNGQLMAESRKVMEDHLLMVADFLGVMGELMIVVGALALASTMGLAVLERSREIGVMRAIGARHGSIMSMVQLEGLTIALLGWLIAIPLSLPMSFVLGRAFGRIMIPLAVTWIPAPSGVALWFVVVVVVSLVSCAWPAWRASRITTRAALAYE